MAELTKKLYVEKNNNIYSAAIYDSTDDISSQCLSINVDGINGYIELGDTTGSNATPLRISKNDIKYAILGKLEGVNIYGNASDIKTTYNTSNTSAYHQDNVTFTINGIDGLLGINFKPSYSDLTDRMAIVFTGGCSEGYPAKIKCIVDDLYECDFTKTESALWLSSSSTTAKYVCDYSYQVSNLDSVIRSSRKISTIKIEKVSA